jgi:hypothetical protein
MPPPPLLKPRAPEVSSPFSLSCVSRPSRCFLLEGMHIACSRPRTLACITAGAGDEEAAAAAAAAISHTAAQAGVMPEQGVLRVENGFPIVSPEAGVFPCSCASLSRGCCVFARACVDKASLVQHVRCLSTVQDGLPASLHSPHAGHGNRGQSGGAGRCRGRCAQPLSDTRCWSLPSSPSLHHSPSSLIVLPAPLRTPGVSRVCHVHQLEQCRKTMIGESEQ